MNVMTRSLFAFLWFAPSDEPRVEADFADVVSVEEPAEEPLQTQSVAAVPAGAELALVRVPVVGLGVQPLLLVGVHQLVVVVHTHRTAHNLAHVGHQDVDRLRERGIVLAPETR